MKYIPLWAKILIWLSIIGTFLGFIGFGALMYYAVKTGVEDRKTMDAAIQEIELPSAYQQSGPTYETENCPESLCAKITYVTTNNTPLSKETVHAALISAGYEYQSGDYYTKTVDSEDIHVSVDQYDPDEIVMDLSF